MPFRITSLFFLIAACVTAQPPQYELNDAQSTVRLNGVNGTAQAPAVTTVTAGSVVTASLASTSVGMPYDVGIVPAALVPASAGAFITGAGQIVNLDPVAPGRIYLWGGMNPSLSVAFPFSSFSLPFNAPPTALTVSFQMFVVAASAPDGASLSQGCQLETTVGGLAGPQGDDQSVTIPVAASGAGNSVPFYGTSYTSISICTNGRVNFGGTSNSWVASVTEALNQRPFVGFWTDLNPVLGGSITIDNPAPAILGIHWNNVPYYGEPSTANNFSILFNTTTGVVRLTGLTGIVSNPLNSGSDNDAQFLGLSRGGLGATVATNSGPTAFATGMSGTPAATDMIYDFSPQTANLVPSLVPGTLNEIRFTPSGGGYSWQGL